VATPLALVWDLIANDAASPTFARVAKTADKAAASTDRAAGSIAGFSKKIVGAFAGIAAVDIGAHMVKDAVQFQKSMLSIQTQAGASAAEVRTLSAAVLKMAGSVGTGPEQLATSLYHIVSASQGILSTSQKLDTLRTAAEGAKVGNANLEETTNALTSAIVSGIPGVQNMQQAMGSLNAIVGVGDMRLSDLNDALGTGILKSMKQYGLSLTDVGAALADFGDNNIRGADAATMLRVAVQAMVKPVAGGQKTLSGLGITAGQLGRDLQQGGLNTALIDLKTHLDAAGVKGVKVGQVLLDAFGKKASVGIPIMIDDLTRIQLKMQQIKAGATGFGTAWNATQGTASFALSSIAAEAQAASIAIGNKLLPTVTAVAKWLGTELPGAAHIASAAFAPFGEALGATGSAAKSAFGGIESVVKPIAPELRDITIVALSMWAGFKAGTLAAAALNGVFGRGGIIDGIRLQAMYASDSVRTLGSSFKTSAAAAAASSTVIEGEAAAASATVVASGDAARIGWAGLAGPIVAVAVGIITLVSLFHKSSSASKEAAAAAKAYTDALKGDGANQTTLVDAIVKQLSDNNVPQKIADLNKSLADTAATGGKMNTTLNRSSFDAKSFVTAIQDGGKSLADLKSHLQAVVDANTKLALASENSGVKYDRFMGIANRAKVLLKDLTSQYGGLIDAVKKDLIDTKALSGVSASIDKVSQSTMVAAGTATTYAQMLGIAVDKNGVAAVSSDTLAKAVQTVSDAYANSTQTGDGFLAALNSFSQSAGTASDRAALIGATLKAANGDALNFAGAMNATSVASHTLLTDMQQAAAAIGKNGISTKSFIKSIVDLKTGTIDYSKAAAAPLISDLQGMQTSAMNAAQAMYQHAKATMSSKDAADAAYKVYVTQTKGQFIDADGKLTEQARKLGLNKAEAKKLSDQYFGMPRKVKTLIEQEGANPIVTVLNKIGTQLAYLTGHSWTAVVDVVAKLQTFTLPAVNLSNPSSRRQPHAAGGTVTGPGTGTSDSVPIMASNGEEVIRASQAAKHRGLLKAINAGVGGFASGGTVGGGIVVRGVTYGSERTARRHAIADMKAQIALGVKIDHKDFANLNKAIKGTVDQAAAAFKSLYDDAQKVGVGKSLLKMWTRQDAELNKEIGIRNGIAAKLAAVKQKMADAASSVSQAVGGFFDVTSAGAGTVTGAVTGSGIQAQQKQALNQIKEFSKDIGLLEKRHLNSTYLQSLASKGPDALPQLRALLSLSSSGLASINTTETAITKIAGATGAGVANTVYGQQAATLAAQEQAADRRAARTARVLEISIEHAVARAVSRPVIATYKGKTLFEIVRAEETKAKKR
jgi:hypothetical protein